MLPLSLANLQTTVNQQEEVATSNDEAATPLRLIIGVSAAAMLAGGAVLWAVSSRFRNHLREQDRNTHIVYHARHPLEY